MIQLVDLEDIDLQTDLSRPAMLPRVEALPADLFTRGLATSPNDFRLETITVHYGVPHPQDAGEWYKHSAERRTKVLHILCRALCFIARSTVPRAQSLSVHPETMPPLSQRLKLKGAFHA